MDPLMLAGAAGALGGSVAALFVPIAVRRLVAMLRRRPSAAPDTGGLVFVRKGTRAWLAWAQHRGKDPDEMLCDINRSGQKGWWFASLFPPCEPAVVPVAVEPCLPF